MRQISLGKAAARCRLSFLQQSFLREMKRLAWWVSLQRPEELRRLEQQFADQARLLQQDKMVSLGRLAASVVHEYK